MALRIPFKESEFAHGIVTFRAMIRWCCAEGKYMGLSQWTKYYIPRDTLRFVCLKPFDPGTASILPHATRRIKRFLERWVRALSTLGSVLYNRT